MEKFAERFCKDTEAFANADTAYVLAYSIIMLNTDAHSPKIAKKMTLAEFLRNNRGINDGADLPAELLEGIYERITAEGFKVKEDDGAPEVATPDTKVSSHDKYRAEAHQLMAAAQGLLKRASEGGSSASDFVVANKVEYVTAILQLGWAPMLAALRYVCVPDDPSFEPVNEPCVTQTRPTDIDMRQCAAGGDAGRARERTVPARHGVRHHDSEHLRNGKRARRLCVNAHAIY